MSSFVPVFSPAVQTLAYTDVVQTIILCARAFGLCVSLTGNGSPWPKARPPERASPPGLPGVCTGAQPLGRPTCARPAGAPRKLVRAKSSLTAAFSAPRQVAVPVPGRFLASCRGHEKTAFEAESDASPHALPRLNLSASSPGPLPDLKPLVCPIRRVALHANASALSSRGA